MLGLLLSVILLNFRPFEPVILNGEQIPEFDHVSLNQLFCAAFRDGNWEVVPFQIDEQDVDGSFFMPDDGLLDANDELVLDPQDGGGLALVSHFGDFAGADAYPRVQIKATDPLSGDMVYFYLFRSAAPPPLSPIERVQYDGVLDEITCDHYSLGFHAAHRRWDRLQVWEGSQFSADLLDREKMRVSGSMFSIPYVIDETNFEFLGLSMVTGPLRVLRQVRGRVTVFTFEFDLPIEKHYYNGLVTTPDGSLSYDPSMGVETIRISVDWSPDSLGTSFNNAYLQDILIDGQPDIFGPVVFTPEDLSSLWSEFTRDNWSLVQIGNYQGIASDNRLYYYDDLLGGTGDGTSDTGDGVSYGDTGIIFDGLNTGEHKLSSKLLVDATGSLDGPTAKDQFLAPIITELVSQNATTGLGELYDLWRQENPENPPALITILDMISTQ